MKRPVARKLVVLGDGGCGKTSLLTVYTKGHFPNEYEPTVFENYVETLQVGGQSVDLSMWDTAGQEDFDRLRSLCYADTHVVMICFSVDRPASLANVESRWMPEVKQHCPGVKIILAALKCDLREDLATTEKLNRTSAHPVSYDDGFAVARRIGATRYLECSARLNRGVQEALHETAQVALEAPGSRGAGPLGEVARCCTIL